MRLPSIRIIFLLICLVAFASVSSRPVFAQTCSQLLSTPNIYQIDRSATSALLYITPINETVKSYTIFYGLSEGDDRYSTTFDYGQSSGAITYTVNGLNPGLGYFYRIRANNDCSQSPSSEWVADSIAKAQLSRPPSGTMPVAGAENNLAMLGVGSVLAILVGLTFFVF